jgi:hypothetical protein
MPDPERHAIYLAKDPPRYSELSRHHCKGTDEDGESFCKYCLAEGTPETERSGAMKLVIFCENMQLLAGHVLEDSAPVVVEEFGRYDVEYKETLREELAWLIQARHPGSTPFSICIAVRPVLPKTSGQMSVCKCTSLM